MMIGGFPDSIKGRPLRTTQIRHTNHIKMSPQKNFSQVFEGSTTKFADVAGLKIAYEDSGESDRPIIFCIPGIGDVRQQYRFLAPKLRDAGYRVIVTDIRGGGESSSGFTTCTVEDQASDILAVLDAEQITKPVVFVANSFAAASLSYIAANASAGRPSAVAGVVTIGGFFRPMPADTYFRPISYLLFPKIWGTTSWIAYYRTLYKSPPADFESHVAALTSSFASDKNRVSALGEFVRASKVVAWEALTTSPGIKAPMFLVMGSGDPDFADPKEEVEFVKKSVIDARGSESGVSTLVVEAAGHYPHIEKPDEVFEGIKTFVKSIGF
ncbi:Alpha/Beta hydrolase protein [Cladochytrium replicatum]|nr:Alpha/Beta hydrolase protein [Cladochytrium replicatum]